MGCQLDMASSSVDMRALEVMPGREARVTAVVREAGAYTARTPSSSSSADAAAGGSAAAVDGAEAAAAAPGTPAAGRKLRTTRTLELELKYDAKAQLWRVHQVLDISGSALQ